MSTAPAGRKTTSSESVPQYALKPDTVYVVTVTMDGTNMPPITTIDSFFYTKKKANDACYDRATHFGGPEVVTVINKEAELVSCLAQHTDFPNQRAFVKVERIRCGED